MSQPFCFVVEPNYWYESACLRYWRKTYVPLWRSCRIAIFAGLLSQFYFCTLFETVSAGSLCWTLFQNFNEFIRRATAWYFYRVQQSHWMAYFCRVFDC